MNRVLGIDIGGTYTRYGVVENKQVSNLNKIYTKDIKDFVTFVEDIVTHDKSIEGVSIGVPGIVKDNEIISIPNYKPLEVRNLHQLITDKINKTVFINKDVNLIFENDLDRLSLKDTPDVLGFYLGTGLGNGIKINHQLIRGTHGFAGELGHIPIIGNKNICGCGNVGHAETIVSGKALVRLFYDLELSGEFTEIFLNHVNHPEIERFIENFAKVIAMEINILDITTIIIGGGVCNMEGFPDVSLKSLICKELRAQSLAEDLIIHIVDDNPINGIIGASLIINN